jgi:Arc/MetJ-type ribon-helix-helix transcriptional regulator
MRRLLREEGEQVKIVQVELPDQLAKELSAVVQAGWFHNEDEAIRAALTEFVGRHRFELMERFQREDIAWALEQKKNKK